MLTVIAIGDTTQDIFLQMSDASLLCDKDDTNCKICFSYANKIGVEKKTDIPAVGNAANHANGMGRLGVPVGIYTVVGDDDQGQKAKQVFTDNHVNTDYMVFDKGRGTNLSTVINFRSERTIFVYHEPRDYKLPEFREVPEWFYLTSASGDGVKALHEQVLAYKKAYPEVKIAFNPGTHQIHLGKDELMPLFKHTEILFLNREESAEILGIKTRDIHELTQAYHQVGVKIMVITDGPDGAYVSDGKQIWFVPIFAGPVVERTGAGDSYGTAFLAAIIKGKPIDEAMLWGNANSTSVVQYIGAREGLLTEEGILQSIAENPQVKPTLYTK